MSILVETWKPVVGFEGWYEVSDFGRIKRVRAGISTTVGHILNPKTGTRGYKQVAFFQFGKANWRLVHRVVAAAFLGPCPDGMEVNHIDFNRTNNHLKNLEYTTRRDNAWHSNKRFCRGERQWNSKLKEVEVLEIKRRLKEGALHREIADTYGVSESHISSIHCGRTWRHV